MINFEKKLEQFKNLPLLKQSVITVGVVGATVALLGNYKSIKDTMGGLVTKYKENESVKEFIKDVSELVKPITDKVENLLGDTKEEVTEENKGE